MGNCQAVDAAALVIQHPSGRIDRMFWPVAASEVMKMNPGHYVSLIIPLPMSGGENNPDDKTVRFTRVKLLRPSETLVLGRAYRLVTNQEVIKVLKAKKYAKMKKNQPESIVKLEARPEKQRSSGGAESGKSEDNNCQMRRRERQWQRQGSTNIGRSKSWRPSLQSISEVAG